LERKKLDEYVTSPSPVANLALLPAATGIAAGFEYLLPHPLDQA